MSPQSPEPLENSPASQDCPLCESTDTAWFHRDRHREYFRCRRCDLRFVPAHQRPTRERERAEYDRHRNSPEDPGYRRFLSRLHTPLEARLAAGSEGLDFGCGPGPTLSLMFAESGMSMAVYDPFYAPDTRVLARQYDFITATEVVEHLHHPRRDLDGLWRQLRPGGHLGIMTKLALEVDAFARWHYIRDPTHVVFFSRDTFRWLARRWQAGLEFFHDDVIVLTRSPAP